ncbi:MAG: DUF4129 domain-containing transglutaminase family protein, partial [Gammaproteobacteria bacterium]
SSMLAPPAPIAGSRYISTFMKNLPEGSNPRAFEFARELREQTGSDRDFVDRVMSMFREQEFYYTLTPPSLGEHTVDEFLFETRSGFCGHYASAFTLLARAAGIPARIVTGYQGAEFNPLGNYWIVRHADAHAWTEVWIDGNWVRFDPTAAVAPWRIERGYDDALELGPSDGGALGSSSFVNRLVMSWDAINAGWNRWVLSFGPEAQMTMMSLAGIENPSTENLVIAMSVSVTLLLIVIGLWQRNHHKPRRDILQTAYVQLCNRVARSTRPRNPSEGPREYVEAIGTMRPDIAHEIDELIEKYISLRYDGQSDETDVRSFAETVRRYRPAPRRKAA